MKPTLHTLAGAAETDDDDIADVVELIDQLSATLQSWDTAPNRAQLPHIFYTAGYQGHTPETLLQLAERLNLGVVDVRFQARSRNPHWRLYSLARFFGLRYIHLSFWGNTRYKDGPPIHIADFEGGLRGVSTWLACRPYAGAILLCQCREAECCHRVVLAERLRGLGYTVQELDWWQATDATTSATETATEPTETEVNR